MANGLVVKNGYSPGLSMLHFVRPFTLLRAACLLLAGAAILNADDAQTTVESLRAMPPPALAAGIAVQVSGVVTYLRDTPEDFNFILDDGTGGVMVYPTKGAAPARPASISSRGDAFGSALFAD